MSEWFVLHSTPDRRQAHIRRRSILNRAWKRRIEVETRVVAVGDNFEVHARVEPTKREILWPSTNP